MGKAGRIFLKQFKGPLTPSLFFDNGLDFKWGDDIVGNEAESEPGRDQVRSGSQEQVETNPSEVDTSSDREVNAQDLRQRTSQTNGRPHDESERPRSRLSVTLQRIGKSFLL